MASDSWTTESTQMILGMLAESDLALSKRAIEVNLEITGNELSDTTIKQHLTKAEIATYVEKPIKKGGWYVITEKGRRWLESDT